jgi:hypothetical protein
MRFQMQQFQRLWKDVINACVDIQMWTNIFFNEAEQIRFMIMDDINIRLQFSALQNEHWRQILTKFSSTVRQKKKGKAIPVTDREGR